MGYCMFLMYEEFEILQSFERKALDRLEQLGLADKEKDTIKDVFRKYQWDIHLQDNKWTDIEFNGEKYSQDHDKLFEAIAPFVKRDSYIQMQGEDGVMWRWLFDGIYYVVVEPEIRWPSIEEL